MRKIYEILTPENVILEYELAGLGSRFAAFLIDSLIQGVLLILIAGGMAIGQLDFGSLKKLDSWIVAIGIILLFVVFFGYFIFFEMISNGQSPGKRFINLRVIKQNGEPVGIFESLLRNILRLADFLPSLNLAGALFIMFSSKYKRIGDFAANTIVVKVKKDSRPVHLDFISTENEDDNKMVNIYPVNNIEYGILKDFLARKGQLGKRKRVFNFHLNKYFMNKFGLEKPIYNTPEEFFEVIIKMNSGI